MLALAKTLRGGDVDVICVDTNPHACGRAEAEGLTVLFANGLAERTLARAEVEGRTGVIALTSNDELNYLFARAAKKNGSPRMLVVVTPDSPAPNLRMLRELHGELLFGDTVNVELWAGLLRQDMASVHTLRMVEAPSAKGGDVEAPFEELASGTALPLCVHRDGEREPFTAPTKLRPGDAVSFVVSHERTSTALEQLRELGFEGLGEEE